jgi:hypothetical protein
MPPILAPPKLRVELKFAGEDEERKFHHSLKDRGNPPTQTYNGTDFIFACPILVSPRTILN